MTKTQKKILLLERYFSLLNLQMRTASKTPNLVKLLASQAQQAKGFLKQIQLLYGLIKKKQTLANGKSLNVGKQKYL